MEYDLVFEGGGAKGMAFVGAMQAFEAAGHNYDRLLGTSAGAITASLLAAGYSSQRMLAALSEEDESGRPIFADFLGVPGPFEDSEVRASVLVSLLNSIDVPMIPDRWERNASIGIAKALLRLDKFCSLFSFVEQGGLFSALSFLDWMKEKLDEADNTGLTGSGKMTLSEFFQATGKELSVIAANTTSQRMLVLNHRTAPNCPLVWAIRMSMSIPLIWPEVEWQKDWGLYRGKDIVGNSIVDGGILSNFPIELLVSDQPQVEAVMGQKKGKAVLGFLIDESIPVLGAPTEETTPKWVQLRLVRRLLALIETMTTAHDKEVMDAFDELVVRLPARGYTTMEFGMENKRREALVTAGREATMEYLRKCEEPRRRAKGPPVNEGEKRATIADRIATRILEL